MCILKSFVVGCVWQTKFCWQFGTPDWVDDVCMCVCKQGGVNQCCIKPLLSVQRVPVGRKVSPEYYVQQCTQQPLRAGLYLPSLILPPLCSSRAPLSSSCQTVRCLFYVSLPCGSHHSTTTDVDRLQLCLTAPSESSGVVAYGCGERCGLTSALS